MSALGKPWDIYFQPGQIIFHVTRDFNGDPTALIKWANDVAKNKGQEVTISAPEVSRFETVKDSDSQKYSRQTSRTDRQPAVARRPWKWPSLVSIFQAAPRAKIPPTFSLVSAKVDKGSWQSFKAYEVGENLEAQEAQKNAFNELLDLIILLDKNRKSAPVKLEAVSPNWLMSGGPSGAGSTGGPGGRPSPADPADAGTRTFSSQSQFLMRIPQIPEFMPGATEKVTVAILDTSYSIQRLEEIRIARPQHSLITSLLGTPGALRGANGALNVHADPIAENYLPGVKINGHDYDMTDHGLFVAGIINCIAPQAELHLYQVLNRYGLGDLLSIARALQDIMTNFSDRPDKLIINMSLTMNMPLENEHLSKKDDAMGLKILDQKLRPEWFWNLISWICRILQWILQWFFPRLVLRCRWSWFDRQALAFEWMSDLLYVLGPGMIAAAGNNGSKGYRPSACYPAAFDSVLGVGALSRGVPWNLSNPLKPASYSDLADTPTTQGVTAFGGEEGVGNGVPGVYVGNIPDGTPNGTPNATGWAWWSGTSFATPIISGLAAALVMSGKAARAREAINILLNTSTDFTPEFEDIIPVEP